MPKTVSKYFFKNFGHIIYNHSFASKYPIIRSVPFITFSDLKVDYYGLIAQFLDKIGYNKDLFISIGKKQAPFGITLDLKDDKDLRSLLNSSCYSFVFTDKTEETNYILMSILGGVIPICNLNHIFIKELKLSRFATLPDLNNIIDKMGEIQYNQHVYSKLIKKLSWQYFNQAKKWKIEK